MDPDTVETAPSQPNRYRIGAPTTTSDGLPGTVRALVVDPHSRTVTNLAVEPTHHHHQARLVPAEITTVEPSGVVHIACGGDAFESLDTLEQLEIVDAGPDRAEWFTDVPLGFERFAVWVDQPPHGELTLRRGTPVRSTSGEVGHVDGLLTDDDGRITSILVAHGHLWRRRAIAVPTSAITLVDADGVSITGTWEQLGEQR